MALGMHGPGRCNVVEDPLFVVEGDLKLIGIKGQRCGHNGERLQDLLRFEGNYGGERGIRTLGSASSTTTV